jgi:hypothetical protein
VRNKLLERLLEEGMSEEAAKEAAKLVLKGWEEKTGNAYCQRFKVWREFCKQHKYKCLHARES